MFQAYELRVRYLRVSHSGLSVLNNLNLCLYNSLLSCDRARGLAHPPWFLGIVLKRKAITGRKSIGP